MFPNYSLVRAECHNNHSMHIYLRQTKPNILLFLISTLRIVIRVIIYHFYLMITCTAGFLLLRILFYLEFYYLRIKDIINKTISYTESF